MKKLTLLVAGLMLSGMFSIVRADDMKPMGDAAKPAATTTEAKPKAKKMAKKHTMKKKAKAAEAAKPADAAATPAAPATTPK